MTQVIHELMGMALWGSIASIVVLMVRPMIKKRSKWMAIVTSILVLALVGCFAIKPAAEGEIGGQEAASSEPLWVLGGEDYVTTYPIDQDEAQIVLRTNPEGASYFVQKINKFIGFGDLTKWYEEEEEGEEFLINKEYPIQKIYEIGYADINFDQMNDLIMIGETEKGKCVFIAEIVDILYREKSNSEYLTNIDRLSNSVEELLGDHPTVEGVKEVLFGKDYDGTFQNYQDAYELVARIEYMKSSTCYIQYNLIYFNDDDIPDLVAVSSYPRLYLFEGGRVYGTDIVRETTSDLNGSYWGCQYIERQSIVCPTDWHKIEGATYYYRQMDPDHSEHTICGYKVNDIGRISYYFDYSQENLSQDQIKKKIEGYQKEQKGLIENAISYEELQHRLDGMPDSETSESLSVPGSEDYVPTCPIDQEAAASSEPLWVLGGEDYITTYPIDQDEAQIVLRTNPEGPSYFVQKINKFIGFGDLAKWYEKKEYPIQKIYEIGYADVNFDQMNDLIMIGETEKGKCVFIAEIVDILYREDSNSEYLTNIDHLSNYVEELLGDHPTVEGVKEVLFGKDYDGTFQNYQDAYELVARIENMKASYTEYNLIYFNDDDIPDLVAASSYPRLYLFEGGRVYGTDIVRETASYGCVKECRYLDGRCTGCHYIERQSIVCPTDRYMTEGVTYHYRQMDPDHSEHALCGYKVNNVGQISYYFDYSQENLSQDQIKKKIEGYQKEQKKLIQNPISYKELQHRLNGIPNHGILRRILQRIANKYPGIHWK